MSMANRDQAIMDFQEKPGVNILIVSLKAAALGLNLVAANHVVLLDLVSYAHWSHLHMHLMFMTMVILTNFVLLVMAVPMIHYGMEQCLWYGQHDYMLLRKP